MAGNHTEVFVQFAVGKWVLPNSELYVEIVKETIVVGCISFDSKSGRFCPGIPISLSLLICCHHRNQEKEVKIMSAP